MAELQYSKKIIWLRIHFIYMSMFFLYSTIKLRLLRFQNRVAVKNNKYGLAQCPSRQMCWVRLIYKHWAPSYELHWMASGMILKLNYKRRLLQLLRINCRYSPWHRVTEMSSCTVRLHYTYVYVHNTYEILKYLFFILHKSNYFRNR